MRSLRAITELYAIKMSFPVANGGKMRVPTEKVLRDYRSFRLNQNVFHSPHFTQASIGLLRSATSDEEEFPRDSSSDRGC